MTQEHWIVLVSCGLLAFLVGALWKPQKPTSHGNGIAAYFAGCLAAALRQLLFGGPDAILPTLLIAALTVAAVIIVLKILRGVIRWIICGPAKQRARP